MSQLQNRGKNIDYDWYKIHRMDQLKTDWTKPTVKHFTSNVRDRQLITLSWFTTMHCSAMQCSATERGILRHCRVQSWTTNPLITETNGKMSTNTHCSRSDIRYYQRFFEMPNAFWLDAMLIYAMFISRIQHNPFFVETLTSRKIFKEVPLILISKNF